MVVDHSTTPKSVKTPAIFVATWRKVYSPTAM
jgi:hypothetical protein